MKHCRNPIKFFLVRDGSLGLHVIFISETTGVLHAAPDGLGNAGRHRNETGFTRDLHEPRRNVTVEKLLFSMTTLLFSRPMVDIVPYEP